MKIVLSFVAIFLFSCNSSNFTETDVIPISGKLNDTVSINALSPQKENTSLIGLNESYFNWVSADSISEEINASNYNQLPLEIIIEIRKSLGFDSTPRDLSTLNSSELLYEYKSLQLTDEYQIIIFTTGAKYGYNKIYASLYNNFNNEIIKTILIARSFGDVGDVMKIKTNFLKENDVCVIGVYKRYWTDDLLMGNPNGVYKLHYDSLHIYEFHAGDLLLKSKKNSF